MATIVTMASSDKNEKTTIEITRKLLKAIKKDGFMGETYEDVLWRWKGKDARKRKDESPAKYEDSL